MWFQDMIEALQAGGLQRPICISGPFDAQTVGPYIGSLKEQYGDLSVEAMDGLRTEEHGHGNLDLRKVGAFVSQAARVVANSESIT